TPLECFADRAGGFTIETLIMFISGHALGNVSVRYLRELINNYEKIRLHQQEINERMNILDSMAGIYDNVNLINFIDCTETSMKEDGLIPRKIDMSIQTHTAMNERLKDHVMPDQLEDFLSFTSIKTVRARLTHKKVISGDFIDIFNGWFRAQYISVDSTLDGIPNIVIYTTRNIDEEKRREEHLIRISLTDELTRLFNRRCYEEDIAIYREKGLDPDFVLLSVDVNGLKLANDTKGHAAGDELIKGAADCLAASVGTHGKAYRTGGDEFLAIVHTDDPGDMVERIRRKTKQWHGMYLDEMSMSVGYAAYRDHENMSIDDLEKIADTNMYADKERHYREKGIDRRKG
ncbi:MAG: GGDEF domain-containing protein, partial [Lachnospiraceae bacterium]|nr:GGDEF domain-containing protein [Lachnospiraceae bacterium]